VPGDDKLNKVILGLRYQNSAVKAKHLNRRTLLAPSKGRLSKRNSIAQCGIEAAMPSRPRPGVEVQAALDRK